MKRILGIVLILVATIATAKQHDETNVMRQLDPLVGKWQCNGTAFATPWFPEHPTVAEVSQNWILDGKWLAYTYAEKKTEQNPTPFTATGFFGYDPEEKVYVVGGVDSTGGYATGESKGWIGDVLTFEGPWHIGGMTAKARDTFTKKGADIVHLGELESNGEWMKLSQETCTKK